MLEVGAYSSSDVGEHDDDLTAAPAADDRPGRPNVDAELGDRCAGAAVTAGSAHRRHLAPEELEQLTGDGISVEGVHQSSLAGPGADHRVTLPPARPTVVRRS